MIVRPETRWSVFIAATRRRCLTIVIYSALIIFVHEGLGKTELEVPVAIPALLGTVLSILLGFRTNSAYERWWEARKIWGAIVNDSRTFARQILTFLTGPDGEPSEPVRATQVQMIHRQAAWNHALGRSLRGQDPIGVLAPFLPIAEIEALRSAKNVPNAILDQQALALREARAAGDIDGFGAIRIDETLTHLCDAMGMCERIKNTVFPPTYTNLIGMVVWLFTALIPLGLVLDMGWFALPVAVLLSSMFVLIETISYYLQDPFDNKSSDTPVTALARTIEINLRQQLGETELPLPIEAEDGILM